MRTLVSIFLVSVLLTGAIACSHHEPEPAATMRTGPQVDQQQMQKLYVTLESMPPSERANYLKMHPELTQAPQKNGTHP